ncbi:histidine phosphatase family protein [Jeotgalibacillus proteolyticus]|uniref:Histidine phosphatase family protein n=1 Tax=Jeotgalibacillus proteolyticus TaxID=2082395 RepID=A0A2S5G9R5_9BACL|nr:histidine phosphatase family protein [Jeotgalibacillus proteolyticus]PPA69661.1 histidine phosphatase family protein [Jeotgalibacillus proteolyticus]
MESHTSVVLSLYRHGVTRENQEKIYIGWTDVPVAEEGIDLLMKTKANRPEAERVISSDLKRCVQSADYLFPEEKKIYHKGLREIHFGDWEGKKADELSKRKDFATWLEDPENMRPENGESFEEFSTRIQESWEMIREWCFQDGVKKIAIVSHGGPIRQLLTLLAPAEKPFWEWKPLHGQGITLYWQDAEAFRRGERCTSLSAVPIMEKENG